MAIPADAPAGTDVKKGPNMSILEILVTTIITLGAAVVLGAIYAFFNI